MIWGRTNIQSCRVLITVSYLIFLVTYISKYSSRMKKQCAKSDLSFFICGDKRSGSIFNNKLLAESERSKTCFGNEVEMLLITEFRNDVQNEANIEGTLSVTDCCSTGINQITLKNYY